MCPYLYCSIVSLGANITEKQYATGFRLWLIRKILTITSVFLLLNVGVTVEKRVLTNDDVSYEHYLGPDYRIKKSTIPE